MEGTELECLSDTKDLGVTFNSKLSFDTHIDNIIAKAKQRLYLLRKSFVSCDCRALILAFKTYILPLLEYCSPVWSPCLITDILRIEAVQRKFTKSLIICDDNVSYKERLETCELKSLEYRRLLADLYLFYKITNHLITIDLGDSLLPFPANSVTRGHSRRFKIPPARLNSRLHFFTHRTIRVWNCLTEPTVSAVSLNEFKSLVGREDLSNFVVL